jgi:hypothetical protein
MQATDKNDVKKCDIHTVLSYPVLWMQGHDIDDDDIDDDDDDSTMERYE